MHGFYGISLVALLGFQQALAVAPPPRPALTRENIAKIKSEFIPGRFLVEFEDVNALTKRSSTGDPVTEFIKALKSHGITAKPRLNITSGIFNGASFTTSTTVTEQDIAALPEVKTVQQVRRIQLPKYQVESLSSSLETYQNYTTHANTGVLEMHEKGWLGQGVTVGVIDSGVDYTHPAFGSGSISDENTIISGYDFVGDEFTGEFTEPKPDDDPMDCVGHGTHVTGIIAGNDKKFVSVAPKAKIRSYKTFGCYGSTSEDQMIAALVRAQQDGCDIINISVGAPNGWPQGIWAKVATKIADMGIIVAIAGGNEGDAGPWYGSTGGSARNVISVASITTEQYVTSPAIFRFGTYSKAIEYLDRTATGFKPEKKLKIYATSTSLIDTADACESFPSDYPDLSGYLVLVKRGGCSYPQKANNVLAAGGKYLLFLNSFDTPLAYPYFGEGTELEGYGMVSFEDGIWLMDMLKGKHTDPAATVEFPEGGSAHGVPNDSAGAGKISPFTSWGPTWEAQIKPEIAAPGQWILSAWPHSQSNGYAILSGTSMAAPYIAGIAALYLSKNGGRQKLGFRGFEELRSRIITSGTPLNWYDGAVTFPSKIAPVAQQGSGYVSAARVLTGTSWVTPYKLELNDTENASLNHVITFRNTASKAVTITVTHTPAETFDTFLPNNPRPQTFPPNLYNSSASVVLIPNRITVAPYGTAFFAVSFKPPALDAARLPVYSGHIRVSTTAGDVHTIPYMGIGGSMKAQKPWQQVVGTPPAGVSFLDSVSFRSIPEGMTFKLDGSGTGRTPAVVYSNDLGGKMIRFDLVHRNWTEAEWQWPMTGGKVVGSMRFMFNVGEYFQDVIFPVSFVTRNNPNDGAPYQYYPWNGTLSDGSVVPSGEYKVNARILRLYGDERKNEDWIGATSNWFRIER